ncbi:general substrate transporter [Naematelia encephala]|uniref:General substrate transporter n=1 Tax=Naematelia encephala TaxID=71784 RepID=A0A1Y2ASL0_9TREE|nr:general substrate transporter [Naematelia encephala]
MSQNDIDTKAVAEHIETDFEKKDTSSGAHLKSGFDELSLFKTAWAFRKAVIICTLLNFAAAADGYQINLNGNIIANQGFIDKIGEKNAKGVYQLNAHYTALWGALQSLGQFIGMVFLNPISDRIGRKITLYVLWLILCGSLLIESFVSDWRQWAGAKLLAGIGIGCIQSTLPIYVTEWSPVNIRGAMILSYSIWNHIGGFLAPLVLTLLKPHRPLDFKTPIYTQWAFLGIMLPIFVYLPETASFYAARDQDDRGKAVIRRVNGGVPGYDVEAEYEVIKNTILQERQMRADLGVADDNFRDILRTYLACFRGPNLKRTIGSALPASVQQVTGLSLFGTYSSLFFKQAGFTNSFAITSITSGIKVASVLVLALTTDKFGRRNVVVISGGFCTLMLMVAGILANRPLTEPVKNGLIAVACLWSYANAGLGALGWTFVGEVASQKLRARTAGISAAIGVIFGITFITSVPIMIDPSGANMGFNACWVFFGCGVVSTALAWLYVPETARRSPAELDEMYNKGVQPWRMGKYVTDVQKHHAEQREERQNNM